MTSFNLFKGIVSLLCLLQLCGASEIVLTSNTPIIKDGLTETLNLRCSLENTTSEGMGRDSQNSGTSDEIKHVSSIIVSKADPVQGEVILAKIISSGNADANADLENLVVNGSLTPDNLNDPQFLELTWSKPRENQSGRYTCEVYTIDSVGRCAAFKSHLKVEYVALTTDVQELIGEINHMKDAINDMNTGLNAMKATLSTMKAPHYEEGTVTCGHSSSWPKDIAVQFSTSYDTLPMINIAVVHVDVLGSKNARWNVSLKDATINGFTINCLTWADTLIYGLTVRWTSNVA